nr:protein phloem protein 2-like A10-like [Tanacetum cinerariifolium]
MVMALYADRAGAKDNSVERWVDVIADEKCRKVIGDCIQQFVTTMVTVYLDKTMDVNTYDEILAGLTNPKHEEKVRGFLALVCNGAIETFVRSSHQVLTNSRSNCNSDLIRRGSSTISKVLDGQESVLSKLKGRNIPRLAAPSNMRFVLDVTGRRSMESDASLA